jgi:hypothetical protein
LQDVRFLLQSDEDKFDMEEVVVEGVPVVAGLGGGDAIAPEDNADMSQALAGYSDPDQMIKKAFEAMSRQDKAAFCNDLALKVKTHGYVYAAWNSAFPNIIKIGATARQNPYIRLKELSTAGVPGKFELVCCMATMNPFQLEKQIHAHFKTRRSFGYRKEFFEVPMDEVVEYFDQLVANGGAGSFGSNAVPESNGLQSSKKRGLNQMSTPIRSEDEAILAKLLAQIQKDRVLMMAQHSEFLSQIEAQRAEIRMMLYRVERFVQQ